MPVVHHFMTFPSDLYRTLCAIADERHTTLTDVITQALSQVAEDHRDASSLVSAEDLLRKSAVAHASMLMSYPTFRSVH